MYKIANKFHQRVLTIIIVLVIFEGIALKLEKVAQLFLVSIHVYPCHPLATNHRKQFQFLNIALSNKSGLLLFF